MIFDPPELDPVEEQRRVDEIVASPPTGAVALAALAVAIVMALWLVFYLVVFLPRS